MAPRIPGHRDGPGRHDLSGTDRPWLAVSCGGGGAPGWAHKGPEGGGSRIVVFYADHRTLESLQPCMLRQPVTKMGREEGPSLGHGG